MALIKKLFYCPVKSLSFQKIDNCNIIKDVGILNDRLIAFSRNANLRKAKLLESDSYSRNHKDFLSLKNTTALNKYSFYYEDKKLTLKKDGNVIISINLDDKNQHKLLCEKLAELEKTITKPIYLLQNKEYPFFDTTHSNETHNTISLINLNSINDFSKKIKLNIEYERFRGNLYIDDLDAWEERNWINKIIKINNVSFKVDMHIPRCSATNLKPRTNINTVNLPLSLRKIYNHSDLGVYLKPLESGSININDKINIS